MAAGAAQFLGWALFVLLISYFVLVESGDVRGALVPLSIPGYADDIRRLGAELSRIWNAFLRGQIIVFLLATLTYMLVLSVLGVHYALGIAFLAGLATVRPVRRQYRLLDHAGSCRLFSGSELVRAEPALVCDPVRRLRHPHRPGLRQLRHAADHLSGLAGASCCSPHRGPGLRQSAGPARSRRGRAHPGHRCPVLALPRCARCWTWIRGREGEFAPAAAAAFAAFWLEFGGSSRVPARRVT